MTKKTVFKAGSWRAAQNFTGDVMKFFRACRKDLKDGMHPSEIFQGILETGNFSPEYEVDALSFMHGLYGKFAILLLYKFLSIN